VLLGDRFGQRREVRFDERDAGVEGFMAVLDTPPAWNCATASGSFMTMGSGTRWRPGA
jgi:hypothetical protein